MKGAAIPENEAARLEALGRYKILDTTREQVFDEVAQLASFIGQCPMALISFVDRDRQWFKATVGVALEETDRDLAFCAHAILEPGLFVVEDALHDERFAGNPLVMGEPHVRFYAGAPLVTPDGFGVGAVCVLDHRPHRFSSDQGSALKTLARVLMGELEQRRVSADLVSALENVKTMRGLLPMCSYCKGIRNDRGYWLRLEAYLEKNTDAHMTHGICPACLREHFPIAAETLLGETANNWSHETQKLARLLESHARLVAQVRTKTCQIRQICAQRKLPLPETVQANHEPLETGIPG